jgi:hypothetical protein
MRNVLEHPFFANASSERMPEGSDKLAMTQIHSLSSTSASPPLQGDAVRVTSGRFLASDNSLTNSVDGHGKRYSDENAPRISSGQPHGKPSAVLSSSTKNVTQDPDNDTAGSASKKGLFGFRNKMRSSRAHV